MCQTGCNGCNDCGGLTCGEGAAGLDGLNSFTLTTATFVQPDFGDAAFAINVSALGQMTGLWAAVGERIFIEGAGYFVVTASTTTTITIEVPSAAIETINHAIAASGATIALGVKVGPSGVEGAGTNGTNGTNGVTILEIVSTDITPASQQTAVTVSKTFDIPLNTWETVDDMVELEILTIGEAYDTGNYTIYVELNSNPLNAGYANAGALAAPQMSMKLQMALSASGEVTPISNFEVKEGLYASNSGFNLANPSYNFTSKGTPMAGLTTGAAITLDVYLISPHSSVQHKMFYYKLTSYKKLV
jgi:hypothetical protein